MTINLSTVIGAKALRALIEVEETVTFWGNEYKIIPRLVHEILGNGKKLVAITPLNTRPNYYVIRVDSSWNLSNWAQGEHFCDHIGEVIDAIVDEYSDIDSEQQFLIENGVNPERADLAYYPKELGWPVFSGYSGYSWCELDWPAKREAA